MATNPDFSDMLAALSDEGAIYLIVGAHAVMHYTEPRYTKDLDLWVRPDPENAERVFRALSRFGAPLSGVSPVDFATPGTIFQMGLPPNRIDVITSIGGVEFDEAWASRRATSYGQQATQIPSAEILVRNKRSVGRAQDLVDAEALDRSLGRRAGS